MLPSSLNFDFLPLTVPREEFLGGHCEVHWLWLAAFEGHERIELSRKERWSHFRKLFLWLWACYATLS